MCASLLAAGYLVVLIDMPYLGSMLNALQGRMQHPHLHRMDRRPLAYYHSCLVENNLHRCIAGKDSDRKQQESEAVSPRLKLLSFQTLTGMCRGGLLSFAECARSSSCREYIFNPRGVKGSNAKSRGKE